ncbi:hypothetical protein [Sulfurimonas sp. NW9]|uniref:hypothetical protein n=1 Tax=Sulfurimonas sp. NW9 TaxID=2922728 RepID=UPI003DA9BF24
MEKISLCKNEESIYSKDWFTKSIDSQEKLIEMVKNYAYSNACFKDNRRSQKNILGYHHLLILDIDNDETDFTIEDCQKVLNRKGIKALIVPSKSHLKNKNGSIKERYRVFCYLDQVIPADISKEIYKEMMALIVKDLDMNAYIDTKALFDRARFYYPTHNLKEKYITSISGSLVPLDKYLDQAKNNIQNNTPIVKKNKKTKKSHSVDASLNQESTYIAPSVNYTIDKGIYSYDIVAISKELDYESLIYDLEGVCFTEYGNKGTKIKTDLSNTYQHFSESGVIYDFKKDVSYHFVSYIQEIKGCSHTEILELLKDYVDIEQFKSVSSRWQNALLEALKVAKNREEFLHELIKNVNFSCINIHRDKEDLIYVAGKKYHISDFSLQNYKSKQDIVKQFQRNRSKNKKEVSKPYSIQQR